MWNRYPVLWVSISVPHVRWLKFMVPMFIFIEIIDSIRDLVSFSGFITGNRPFPSTSFSFKDIDDVLGNLVLVILEMGRMETKELVDVHIGRENVHVTMKMI
jgi:hypothetical protein